MAGISGVFITIPKDATAVAGTTAPTLDTGSDGDLCLDLNSGFLYGPKDGENAAYPWPVAGSIGQKLTWRGSWGYPLSYNPGDVVTAAGGQYLCIRPIILYPGPTGTTSTTVYSWNPGDTVYDNTLNQFCMCASATTAPPSLALGTFPAAPWVKGYSPEQDWILASTYGYGGALGSWIQLDSTLGVNSAGLSDGSFARLSVLGVPAGAVGNTQLASLAVDTLNIVGSAVTDAKMSTTGVTAGTYPKVTVTTKGRVTAGSSLASSDMPVPMTLTPTTNSTSVFAVQNAGGANVVKVDTSGTSTAVLQQLIVTSALDYLNNLAVRKNDSTHVFAVDTSPTRATVTGESVLNGAFTVAYRAITAARTLDATDHVINCTSGTFTVTLPTAASVAGRTYRIKNSGTGTITIGTTSSQTIDGATTKSLATQYSSLAVVSNGANWIVI